MHSKRIVVLFASLLSPLALLADTPATTQWIVTSAHATGGGTPPAQFVSSLRIVNPNPFPAPVDLTFLPASALDADGHALGDNSGATPVRVVISANNTFAIDDILVSTFGVSPSANSAGGIKVESLEHGDDGKPLPVTVLSQTLVVNAQSADGRPGTNGFAIPGQVADQLIAAGDTGYIPYISSAPAGATTGYRTNLFLLSANAFADTLVHVKLVKGDSTVVGEKDYRLGKLSQTQINGIAAKFGYLASDTNLTTFVTVLSGGPIAIGASIIDNAISSQSYAPPAKVFVANNGAYGLIFNDDFYSASGRLDIQNGLPTALTGTFVLENCPTGASVQPFFYQSFGLGVMASFTKNPDGSFNIVSSSSFSTLVGIVFPAADGTVYGRLTYTRAAGGACPLISRDFPFVGARGLSLTP